MSRPRTPQGYWPKFESDFLGEIVTVLRKRSKSLKHSVDSFSCERVRERTDGVESEKLELKFESFAPRPVRISFSCWDDRWMWLDVRKPARSGWAFEWEHEGRVGATGPTVVAGLLLDMLKLPMDDDANSVGLLKDHWATVAVTGPTGAVK